MTESDLESAIIRLEAAAFRHGADGAFEDATTWLLERTLETLPLRGIGFRTPDLGPSPECLTRGVLSSAQAAELIRTVLPLTVELRADLEHATARVTPAEPLEIEIEGASGLGDDLSAALRAESVTRFWVIPLVLAGPRTASASERGTLLVLHSAPSGSLDSVVRRLQEMWQIFLGSRLRDQDHRTLIAEMDAVLAAPPDAIIVIDAAGTIELVNPATERVFGWKAHELRGNNVRMLMPEPFRVHHDGYLRNYLSTGRARIIGLGREVEALRRDGSIFPVDLSVGEIAPVTGRPRFIGLIRDISERKRTERELAETRDRLTHVSRVSTLGEMASGIAHEVNQPLAAIVANSHACHRWL
ncbi:MAG: PAS domain S-box protein, partial [Candidatus Eisenbacteria bacterium]|nr:PAS domain S-box protein [Candidatus Eisenbacteria bacterium]